MMTTHSSLIKEITPIYNFYKSNNLTISGNGAVKLMWDIGEKISTYINKTNIAPHRLYREIYGKSENDKNRTKNSWITREFLGRCYRIYRIFDSKDTIDIELPSLNSFTNFRETMPFFDNPKYKFKGQERTFLLNLLNSNEKPSKVLNTIREIQKKHIGIKNSRKQLLSTLDEEKNIFVDFYNLVYRMTKDNISASDSISKETLLLLSNNTLALSQDGLRYSAMPDSLLNNDLFQSYYYLVKKFVEEKNFILIRRFRRVIPPDRFVKLSELIYLLANRN